MDQNTLFPKILLILFFVFWIFFAINPLYRFDWFLENIIIFLLLPIVLLSYFKFRLSNRSYFLIFLFAFLHIAAAHYTYGDTPWGDYLREIFGWERNHYDRIVHFLFGFLMLPVARDILQKHLPPQKFFEPLFLFAVIFSLGALYEVAEFVVGILVKPEAGLAFLGFQGDIWDTQKDMIAQAAGAITSLLFAVGMYMKSK